ncbi:DUF309 domain-containing protein [Staphylococcus croceilyticus]|uniref:DUF309 domain-containing protein n=1 Tax=Staphylococcus croceilyticus TaxID=319942 RepID=A0ABY2KD89_9STAP|nr:DUF309 domain-containing protein [Staphylococcus croceilyticus]PNZ67254.1 DUF309 domain-containing protein [Staphylococcus croceilyticus]TGA79573.1 DUF309 domain-containing protein [Staphylococcus croceilyticus]
MERALIDFYYQFHKHQHYFLCHDILEDAWKAKPNFSKNDAIVSLILFTTAMYHYRRENYIGALKSYKKALTTFQNAKDKSSVGLYEEKYEALLNTQIEKIKQHEHFTPVKLPINKQFENKIYTEMPDYEFNKFIVKDDYIVHHHLRRDRSEVIAARQQALLNKKNKEI